MAILREAARWAKPRPASETRSSSDLTPEEQANVRVAIRFLAKRFETYAKLAEAMKAKKRTVVYAAGKRGHVSAGVALRTARAAGVPLENVLSGVWPAEGTCPHCGHVADERP